MKKEVFMTIFIIIFVVIGNFITQNYTKKFFDEIGSDLVNMRNKILNNSNNENDLKKDFENIQNKWNKKYNFMAYYIEHDELEKIERELWRINAQIEVEEYNDVIIEIEECRFLMEHVKEKERFRFINIF